MLAAGVMLTLWGAASTWIVSVVGLMVIGIGAARWMREDKFEMKTENPWLHRYAIFVDSALSLAIAAGAVVTSLERPIAGPTRRSPSTPPSSSGTIIGMVAGVRDS